MVDQRPDQPGVPGQLAGGDHLAAVADQQDQPEDDVEGELDPAVSRLAQALGQRERDQDRSPPAGDLRGAEREEVGGDPPGGLDRRAAGPRRGAGLGSTRRRVGGRVVRGVVAMLGRTSLGPGGSRPGPPDRPAIGPARESDAPFRGASTRAGGGPPAAGRFARSGPRRPGPTPGDPPRARPDIVSGGGADGS